MPVGLTPHLARLFICLGVTVGPQVHASTPAGVPGVRVGVLPVLSYALDVDDIYQERPAARDLREQAGPWQRRLEVAFDGLDGVTVHPGSEIQSRLLSSRVQEALEVGRERYALGLERYRGLQVEQATEHLGRARELFETAFVDVIEPREVADVALYEGLAVIESGLESHAHVAFRRMWTLDPARSFERGYYPRATEEVVEAALQDLLATPDLAALRWPAERLQALSPLVEVDVWITATIIGSPEAPSIRVRGYDASRRATTLDEAMPLDEWTEERLERVLSSWHGCQVDLAPASFVQPRPR
ncbi:MAG: hypothetical protein QF464_09490, partial [Myxococcota bacterium]|nr:hypothetical protein [Myxococcota bacterium]